ncbi:MAG: SsrA-binding protein SmpB [Clostridiales bacterium]|nr:SsrA-binding protein SmpB [Clostridiales bacterium]
MSKIIAQNRKARHEYFIEDTYEAGISLSGTEVKSVRLGKVNMQDSYASISSGEVWIKNLHISPYEQGNIFNKDPVRPRKALLHKQEINRILGAVSQKGFTLIPLDLHFSGKYVKLSLALARGKKLYDKRATLAEKDAKRKMERAIKNAE